MERATTLSNIWTVIQTLAWIIALDGVTEYFTERQSHIQLRRLVAEAFGRDPAAPRPPRSWEEWYNS